MTKLCVYAISDSPITLSDLEGVQGERLDSVALERGVAVVGRVNDAPHATRATLEAQDRLVRALHEDSTALLPVRFGTTVADEKALVEHPTLGAAVIGPALDRVRGREQMTLRMATNRPVGPSPAAIEPAAGAPGEGRGRRYLERRRSLGALPAEVQTVLTAVAALARGERYQRGVAPGQLVTVYHLIDRGRGDDYRALVGAAASMNPAITVTVNGPAPAYAFAPTAGSEAGSVEASREP